MNLRLNLKAAEGFKSKSQIARVLTESWVSRNVYCPNCGNVTLNEFANNCPVADFFCGDCNHEYELKSKKDSNSLKIVDGAYSTMIQRINSDNNPNFFFLNYKSSDFTVQNFLVIPKHFFIDKIIEKREPLSPNAKRAGWIGCNILLNGIPESGKIHFVKNNTVLERSEVLSNWSKTKFLSKQNKENRGWTIEILNLLDRIQSNDFYLKDVYRFEDDLKVKFPNNNFVKDKIRQQLQVLRDKNFIEFLGSGHYKKV